MKHERFEIWEDKAPIYPLHPWRAQLVNTVAYFATREQAENYVSEVKKYREKHGLDGLKKRANE